MVDASDAPVDSGVMIAFLPTSSEWCVQDLPHMTLVYAGTIEDLTPSDFSALAKDTATIATLIRPFTLQVTNVAVFGDEEKVDVLRFRPTSELLAARRIVEHWNASEHDFNPHATIGPASVYPRDVPRVVGFDRVLLAWGEEQLTFWLKTSY